jgi:hypothetical protein
MKASLSQLRAASVSARTLAMGLESLPTLATPRP